MRKIRDGLFLALGIVIIAWSFYAFLQKHVPLLRGTIGGLVLEIANTDAERTQGLSGRASLPAGTGLLFVFESPGKYGFWMKDMNFPIDIVWLGDGMLPVGIEKNVSPDSYPQVFYPPVPVRYVLEVNAGESSVLELNQ
ncbi:MAG: hypothetical protein A3J09_00920 [Candidatus Zambryskibacteria bacterium RIFCSPLOWO2_02_FULL_51_21]|uniref:DUF192 domain-containing protein n=1 Tax=Candidatus Zambryskibacteria bacterium RIFCSPHIGHO2_02_FULL_43_37 TaxID=1802749 RepID=A0A1G2THI1_9BACT|nr:MAG: hypothetical protein A2723_00920 [Candidatus Zambryskibacteria bacterium RIFCSPHIGHO2_01_FULL_52_18]OHA96760.1 MAG: hypothetical protein A3D49_02880 [Candidatus Zambryskibacteria bacterium RIFCSPHIGHO2_02_FULL_43_37]OHB07453.1 MAG: hypothetical protein A2944_01950 [Candidatus Zambryskibacteria bacterium RIFCSPLOWO2_01_FULL_52_12]OHB11116.1 MAG: hypothetical protein A3J09_00920 [Candidatus Zambryskibacteria bacterium RIFCSPLOWO2_02_FULL_51_21]